MSLSDKACYVGDIVPNLIIFKKEDVKQFIKELKEKVVKIIQEEEHCDDCDRWNECPTCAPHFDKIRKKIDKLAGEGLI